MYKINFDIPASSSKINLKDRIYLSGSCFSDEIGSKLVSNKFNVLSNPFGTIYNPISIFNTLKETLNDDRILMNQGVYYHWDCHGKISGLTEKELMNNLTSAQGVSNSFLDTSDLLVLTLGTSFVYKEKNTGAIVANCHKVQSSSFDKSLLTKDEIVTAFHDLKQSLKKNLQIILTVSPVRHLNDGVIENNLSKSILIQAVHEIVAGHNDVQYFPAYEIVMDELRDYRFFATDMTHPSGQAVDYVWDKFVNVYFDDETKSFVEKWGQITTALNHKPFQPKSIHHQDFVKKTIRQLNELKNVDVSEEIEQLERQLQ